MATDTSALDLIVDRSDLTNCDIALAPSPDRVELADGEVLLHVDTFALTANNITYATFGDAMSYWAAFPAPPGFGRIPVWGFADVLRSSHPDVSEGERFYGFLPMSTHLVVQPRDCGANGFDDGAAHRDALSPIYRTYMRATPELGFDPAHDAQQVLLRPLVMTAFLIDDTLAANGFYGADAVVFSSASSKTAYATAFQLAQRGQVEVIGLTSAANRDFTEKLGWYDRVLAYEDVEQLDAQTPTVYVDMSGSAELRTSVHRHLGEQLMRDVVVGATHHDELGALPDLPGPQPTLFFAPAEATAREQSWGAEGFQSRVNEALSSFITVVSDPDHTIMLVTRASGPAEVERVYLDLLAGRSSPDEGHVVSMHEAG